MSEGCSMSPKPPGFPWSPPVLLFHVSLSARSCHVAFSWRRPHLSVKPIKPQTLKDFQAPPHTLPPSCLPPTTSHPHVVSPQTTPLALDGLDLSLSPIPAAPSDPVNVPRVKHHLHPLLAPSLHVRLRVGL
ncbi:hypothetical protein PVL29_012818 [Vitis rotundifolia]|uniref:Uncharacterized protein n=1 Tax=Vitis rotundifolia TaxID=103349 RepID=A0AA38ZJS0_VITRO|nr:hypothetical protein PVL29_012818 [Vitis rotundifolia]